MERYVIKDLFDLAELMNCDGQNVSCVCFYEDASVLIHRLLELDYTYIESLEIHPEEFNGYCKEYVVSINEEGGIWCEPFYRTPCKCEKFREGYFDLEDDITFVMGDCDKEVLKHIKSKDIVEVGYIDEDDECTCCECHCPACEIERDDMAFIDKIGKGYQFSFEAETKNGRYSTSYYSNDLKEVKEHRNNFFELTK